MNIKHSFPFVMLVAFFLFAYGPVVLAKGGISLQAEGSYNFDSNVFKSASNPESTQYYLVKPKAVVFLDVSQLSFKTGYVGGFSFYPDAPINEYQDLTGFASLGWDHSERLNFELLGSYSNIHLPRGSLESGALPTDPIEFSTDLKVSGKTLFPTYSEKYNIQLQASFNDTVYTDTNAEEKDKNTIRGSTELQYRYSGKTSIVYGYKVNDVRLKSDNFSHLNSLTQTPYVGARWKMTGKTTSHALIGYDFLGFDGPDTSSYGGLSIDLSVKWKRKSFSTFVLSVLRTSRDSLYYGTGYYVNNNLSLDISHKLTNRWSVGLKPSFYAAETLNEYKDVGGDVYISTGFVTRWITVGVRGGYQFRHSFANSDNSFNSFVSAVHMAITI